MTHSINGRPVDPPAGPIPTETQTYANLVDAVHLLNAMIERTKYQCTEQEAQLLWRLRFVTRIQP